MLPLLARVRDRSLVLLTLNYCAGQALYRLGLRRHLSGATHLAHSVEEGAQYVQRVFDDYLAVSGLTVNDLAGSRILEIGPGDNLGVALLFAAHGAAEVTCLDRFEPARDEDKNRAIYRDVISRLPPSARDRAAGVLNANGSLRAERVRTLSGLPIEEAVAHLRPSGYDFIVSRAVLEHVFDVDATWTSMDALAAPGAVLIHKIDFRNHGFYDCLHPLAFLKIPEVIWRLASSPDPTMNRGRTAAWETLACRAGYTFKIVVTHLVSQQEELALDAMTWPIRLDAGDRRQLESLRGKLASPFNTSAVEDLAVAGMFLVARKPRT